MSIDIRNISKSYKSIKALDNISLSIEKDEIFGFIGPDAAGKTSLFRILTSLLIPDEGTALINGHDVVKDYKQIRKITGYMPGRFSLYQDLTVLENLSFFATVFGTTIEENYEFIRDIYIQIEPFKKRLAGKLSGGMKQKLALCCAMIHKPEILILDEPTTGVDAVSRKEFWEMLVRIKGSGIIILVSTPYMDEAKLCDRIALIQHGKIMAIDTPLNIIKEFNKQLIAIRVDDIYRLLIDLREYNNCYSAYPFGQYIHYTDKRNFEFSILEFELKEYLKSKNHNNIFIKNIIPNIEDCFMELMRVEN